jgi:hypothetical protein
MKLSKSDTFKTAWNYARYAASKFGGKAKSYFSECLKRVYRATERTLNDAIFEFLRRGFAFAKELISGDKNSAEWLEREHGIMCIMQIGSEFKTPGWV